MSDTSASRGFERHAVTVGVAIAIALLLYVGKTTTETSAQVAVLQSKFEGLSDLRDSVQVARDQMADLKSRTVSLEYRTTETERAIQRAEQARHAEQTRHRP